MILTVNDILKMMPGCTSALARAYTESINLTLTAYKIDTPLRVAHFMAQIGHESASLQFMEELASGVAYEKRKDLGNVYSGDGKKYKGRGAIQNTGRANYREYTEYKADRGCLIDFVANPAALAGVPYCIDVAGWYWSVKHKLNVLADADKVTTITKLINGGTNGLEDRKKRLGICKTVMNAKV